MEPQAQLFYNVLEAIFDYADENIEPKGLGLMPLEKQLILLDQVGMSELGAECKSIPPQLLAKAYESQGCQIHMIPPYDANASPYEFREPTEPALTKAGWIKSEVLCMTGDSVEQEYEVLQNYVTRFNLKIKDPSDRARFGGDRYMPFPEMSVVVWYAKSLEQALGLKKPEPKPDPKPTPGQQNMMTQQGENELLGQIERDNMNNAFIHQQIMMAAIMRQQALEAAMAVQDSGIF